MAVCTGFLQPLNLECLLINTFAGTTAIFIAVSFILISALSARFKMPNSVFLLIMGLYVVFMYQFSQGFYLVFMVITGLLVMFAISRIVKD